MNTFESLGLSDAILEALKVLHYEKPSEIQAKAIPELLTKKTDIKAFAQTGTGKTAAFSLPILELINSKDRCTQALILSPTRELALQIGRNINDFSKKMVSVNTTTVYGGGNIDTQIKSIRRGAHIVVGTPGRTLDLISRKVIDLSTLRWLVLDEADEMLNMGFKEELDQILKKTPRDKQTLLFSATFPKEVEQIARQYLVDPLEIQAGKRDSGTANVSHVFYQMPDRDRYITLKRIVDSVIDIYAIIFCRTRRETVQVSEKLIKDGYNADSLHGDLSQTQRDMVMQKIRGKGISILVATDVAARGLDIDNLSHVINYRLPDQISTYTHRSGRTGRAGNKGTSILLMTPRERHKLKPIERKIQQKFLEQSIPSVKEICELQLIHLIKRIKDAPIFTEKITSYLPKAKELLQELNKEQLIEKIISIELNQLFDFYKNQSNEIEKSNPSRSDMERCYINLGRKDNLKPQELIAMINDLDIARGIEIGAIEILRNFSFFEVEHRYAKTVIASFENVYVEDRKIIVEISNLKPKERKRITNRKQKSKKGALRNRFIRKS